MLKQLDGYTLQTFFFSNSIAHFQKTTWEKSIYCCPPARKKYFPVINKIKKVKIISTQYNVNNVIIVQKNFTKDYKHASMMDNKKNALNVSKKHCTYKSF